MDGLPSSKYVPAMSMPDPRFDGYVTKNDIASEFGIDSSGNVFTKRARLTNRKRGEVVNSRDILANGGFSGIFDFFRSLFGIQRSQPMVKTTGAPVAQKAITSANPPAMLKQEFEDQYKWRNMAPYLKDGWALMMLDTGEFVPAKSMQQYLSPVDSRSPLSASGKPWSSQASMVGGYLASNTAAASQAYSPEKPMPGTAQTHGLLPHGLLQGPTNIPKGWVVRMGAKPQSVNGFEWKQIAGSRTSPIWGLYNTSAQRPATALELKQIIASQPRMEGLGCNDPFALKNWTDKHGAIAEEPLSPYYARKMGR